MHPPVKYSEQLVAVVVVKHLNAPQGVRCPVEYRDKERSLRTSATNVDDSTFSEKMEKYMQDMCRCPYELSNFQLYGAVFGWNNKRCRQQLALLGLAVFCLQRHELSFLFGTSVRGSTSRGCNLKEKAPGK